MLHANTLTGADAYCFKAFAEALEIIPYTLAENAGLNPIGNYYLISWPGLKKMESLFDL